MPERAQPSPSSLPGAAGSWHTSSCVRVRPLVGILLLGLISCSDAVNPFIESDRRFSLFGTLEMDRDTQFVRVVPITRDLAMADTDPLAVVFTSQDLNTGRILRWADSLMTIGGTVGHVFWAPLRIQAGHRYRLQISGADSIDGPSVEATAPGTVSGVVLEENLTLQTVNGTPPGTQRVVWDGVNRAPFRISLWYRFLDRPEAPFVDVRMDATPVNFPVEGTDMWEVRVDLREDRDALEPLVPLEDLGLVGIGIELTLLDSNFAPPGGIFDPDLLSQPGVFSNVTNGFGFVGIVGRFSVEWALDDAALRELGYRSANDVLGRRSDASTHVTDDRQIRTKGRTIRPSSGELSTMK